ncbi:hypothetical protein EB796_002542 [Bugula neritina]|uniref:TIR domain-containing protein n=1 Tax=Bugula neritina TaxID=10212 RepID=A0A7J7KLN7_BUGNE|nr:hypothetical protein EB796_002542 [Bugula neritina]
MLSYNKEARSEVLKMKERLANRGYKVWIDVEHITAGGSTLEAMAKAVEESSLILIFFSEAYKNSTNCRAEAEYAHEWEKPLLPVRVQPKYKPNGWLGFLLGTKYRYCLTEADRYDSEVSLLLLKVQELITGVQQPSLDVIDGPVIESTVEPLLASAPLEKAVNLECVSWTTQQVAEWLSTSDLSNFVKCDGKMNGEMLAELALLSQHHKDTFYSMVGQMQGVTFFDLLRFSCAVKKLCQQ